MSRHNGTHSSLLIIIIMSNKTQWHGFAGSAPTLLIRMQETLLYSDSEQEGALIRHGQKAHTGAQEGGRVRIFDFGSQRAGLNIYMDCTRRLTLGKNWHFPKNKLHYCVVRNGI